MHAFLRRGGSGAVRTLKPALPRPLVPVACFPRTTLACRRDRCFHGAGVGHGVRWSSSEPADLMEEDPEADGNRLLVGTIVERLPALVTPPSAWEMEWEQFQDELDLVRTKRVPLDMLESEKTIEEDLKVDYKQNPRVTRQDVEGRVKSLNRCLDRGLFLIVKLPGEDFWHFPLGHWQTGETTRETAERSLETMAGAELDSYFLGNAPIGHVQYESGEVPPLKGVKGASGARLFLHHSMYCGGLPYASEAADFAWVPREELKNYLDPKSSALVEDIIYT
jgi:large subunit ribosomal protein L46